MRAIIPEIPKTPEGATKEDRIKMYEEYKHMLRMANPQHFDANGDLREHPSLMDMISIVALLLSALIIIGVSIGGMIK